MEFNEQWIDQPMLFVCDRYWHRNPLKGFWRRRGWTEVRDQCGGPVAVEGLVKRTGHKYVQDPFARNLTGAAWLPPIFIPGKHVYLVTQDGYYRIAVADIQSASAEHRVPK